MVLALGIAAGIILVLYSYYFVTIIKGTPQRFEIEMIKAFAAWIIARGPAARSQVWLMVAASLLLEIIYFLLVFSVIRNSFMLTFSGFFAGVELVHLFMVSLAFHRFFQGKLMLKEIFNWSMERMSAVMFFTHSLLILFSLMWG